MKDRHRKYWNEQQKRLRTGLSGMLPKMASDLHFIYGTGGYQGP